MNDEFDLIISKQAEADLEDIWAYLSQFDPKVADRTLDKIYNKATYLKMMPEMGRLRPDLLPHIRQLNENSYAIFYRINEEMRQVEVIRVIRGSRNLPDLLNPS